MPRPIFARSREVSLDAYDAALLCIPDAAKIGLLGYLVEQRQARRSSKSRWSRRSGGRSRGCSRTRARKGVVLYIAYNHRFEPHFVRMRDLVESGELGRIYRCRMFYGNGTARLVRNSRLARPRRRRPRRSRLALLDTARFWFGDIGDAFSHRIGRPLREPRPDHVVFAAPGARPQLEFEMTLLSWRNHFTCDVFAENGSAHIELAVQVGAVRVHPPHAHSAERPAARAIGDAGAGRSDLGARIRALQDALPRSGSRPILSTDIWLNRVLRKLGAETAEMARAS